MRKLKFFFNGLGLLWCAGMAQGAGIYQDGIGARAKGEGGADVGRAEGPLSSFAINPAGGGTLDKPTLDLGFSGAFAEGKFSNAANNDSPLHSGFNALPEAAFGLPLGDGSWGLVIGSTPEAALLANWRYVDAPGGATGKTTYGLQTDKSEILVLRSGAGLGWTINRYFSVGIGGSAIYNKNTLETPYVFQTQPALKGAKTLLDLETEGFGPNGQAGVLIRPLSTLQIGLSYKSPTTVRSRGEATGNAGAQFADLGLTGAQPTFSYDAEVVTRFPQIASGGVSWQFQPRWRFLGQVDWINWSDSFDTLPVILTHGNNPDLNHLVGSTTLDDNIPLQWRDQFVFRAGLEFAVQTNLFVRGGYIYGRNPVPEGTLTPLTAAITENTLTAGVGYGISRFEINFAYQWNIPNQAHVGASELRSGEYSNSSVEVSLHWLALTLSTKF